MPGGSGRPGLQQVLWGAIQCHMGPPPGGPRQKLPAIGGVRVQPNDDTRARLNKQLAVARVLPFVMGEFHRHSVRAEQPLVPGQLASRSVTVTEKWCYPRDAGSSVLAHVWLLCPCPSGCSSCESREFGIRPHHIGFVSFAGVPTARRVSIGVLKRLNTSPRPAPPINTVMADLQIKGG